MKYALLVLFLVSESFSQTLQLDYDLRHSIDPQRNTKNFPSLIFEEWKGSDYGPFDFKTQADMNGNNIGQIYIQAQQGLKFWKPDIYLFAEYSGGVGVADPGSFGYHIASAYSVGSSCLVLWQGAYFSPSIVYKYTAFNAPSHDAMFSLYWGRGFFDYRLTFSGDFEIWCENKNHGDAPTAGLHGKRALFFGEPQLWYKITEAFSLGARINMYYHSLTYENVLLVYPSVGILYRF